MGVSDLIQNTFSFVKKTFHELKLNTSDSWLLQLMISFWNQINFTYFLFDYFFRIADISETKSRAKRDINIVLRDITHNPVTTWGNKFGEGGACVTAKATYGKCTSYKTCYPYFKKIPNLSVFDSWVLGQYDTCTYLTDDGRQAFGVCCVDPPNLDENKPAVAPVDDNIVVVNKDTVVSNWPPAYITHPPNHTPPTHPPISGNFSNNKSNKSVFCWLKIIFHFRLGSFPVGIYYPTTTKRPVWPPPVPTHPTTTRFPSSANDQVVGNYCGSRNGNLDAERIVGGQEAGVNEFPWVVALFNNGRQFCGGMFWFNVQLDGTVQFEINEIIFYYFIWSTGSLIDNIHILTAAHCVAQ